MQIFITSLFAKDTSDTLHHHVLVIVAPSDDEAKGCARITVDNLGHSVTSGVAAYPIGTPDPYYADSAEVHIRRSGEYGKPLTHSFEEVKA